MLTTKKKIYAIPGWGFSSKLFDHLCIRNYEIIGLDYLHKTHSIKKLAESLSKQISHKSILIGWSFGGLIAIKLAFLFPHLVNKLILLSSQPRFITDSTLSGIDFNVANEFTKLAEDNFNRLAEIFIRLVNYPNTNSRLKKILEKNFFSCEKLILINQLKILLQADLKKDYCTLKCPIFHMMNNKDAILSQHKNDLKKLNSKTYFVSIEQSGHAGFLTHSELYKNQIYQFIENESKF